MKDGGDIDASIVQYRLAIDLKNDLGSAWLNLGICLSQLGRADEAVDAYKVINIDLVVVGTISPAHARKFHAA